jgi:uroporphyrinogen decarboxylase
VVNFFILFRRPLDKDFFLNMSYKSDFIKVIKHQEVKPVPFNIKFTVEAKQKFREYLGRDFDPVVETGSYVIASHTNDGWEEVKPGYFRDYFGVTWNKTKDKTIGVVDDPPLKDGKFGDFRFPDPDKIPVYDFINRNNRKYPDRFHMISIGFSLFERAWSLTGMENFMVFLLTDPGFINELLERITEYDIKVIENAAAIGVDCVHLTDDWGSQNGLMISHETWKEFIKPSFDKICKVAKNNGLLVSLHSCGKVDDLFPDMIEAGVDVFDPFQPEVMDIFSLREQYRNKLAFWGGLSVQKTLPYGTPEDVRAEGNKILQELAPGGGYIFAPSHTLTGDIPIKNILTLLEVAQNQ